MKRCIEVPTELAGSLLELAEGEEYDTPSPARVILCTNFEQTFEKWRALHDRLSLPMKEVAPPTS